MWHASSHNWTETDFDNEVKSLNLTPQQHAEALIASAQAEFKAKADEAFAQILWWLGRSSTGRLTRSAEEIATNVMKWQQWSLDTYTGSIASREEALEVAQLLKEAGFADPTVKMVGIGHRPNVDKHGQSTDWKAETRHIVSVSGAITLEEILQWTAEEIQRGLASGRYHLP